MKEYGLIGFPLGHSYSPELFKEFFKNRPECYYRLFPLEELSLNTFQQFLKEHPALKGFNVTLPYKTKIIPFLTRLSSQAEEVGAVNAVAVRRGDDGCIKLVGHNTDVDGVIATLSEYHHHTNALILGTGGASKAVATALKELGVDFIKVSRRPDEGVITYNDLNEDIVRTHTLIINATPVGMFPNIDSMPDFPVQFLTPEHLVFDLIYNPSPTLLMKEAMKKGAKVTGGMTMLKAQAEAALRFWDKM